MPKYSYSFQPSGRYFVFEVETGKTQDKNLSYDQARRLCLFLNIRVK